MALTERKNLTEHRKIKKQKVSGRTAPGLVAEGDFFLWVTRKCGIRV